MPISNVSAYVLSTNAPSAPFISVNVNTATESDISAASEVYMSNASAYVDDYTALITNKEYVSQRFMYDLCGGAAGITNGGINKESNTISLHEKANDVYEYAIRNRNLNGPSNISGIVNVFDSFYHKYYLTDDESACIINTDSSYYVEAVVYDEKAVTISTVGSLITADTIFVNEIPNQVGTNKAQYTAYVTTSDTDGLINTPVYSVAYNSAYPIGESSSIAVWEMKDVSGESAVTVAYTSDAFDSNAVWTIVSEESSEEESSSESGEEIEEESSSSEE